MAKGGAASSRSSRRRDTTGDRGLFTSGRVIAVVVGVLAGLAYANTLGHGLVWDDPISLERWLPAMPTLSSAFFPPAKIPQFPPDYYRPLQLLSYRLENALGGGAPWPFHLSMVLMHALATVLVFHTGRRLFGSAVAAGWAAALFAVHPIHTESVAWMAARPDVMVTCAGLASLLAWWQAAWPEWRRAVVAAGFVFVALLCKENAAAVLVLVPLSTALVGASDARTSGKVSLRTVVPFLLAGIAYALLRSAGLQRALPAELVFPDEPLSALVAVMGEYLRLLIVPYPHNAYVTELSTGGAALAGYGLLLLGFAAALAWSWRHADRPMVFALLWVPLTLAPSLMVMTNPVMSPLTERYLYLPSVGFCWAIGALVARACRRERLRPIVRVAAICLLALALVRTVQRNRVWQDNFTLWSDTAERSVVDGFPLRSLAAATLDRGDRQAAERLFLQALAERRNDEAGLYRIYNNLGTIALQRGDDATAERYYRQALALQPAADTTYNLGLIALRRGLEASEPSERDRWIGEALTLFERARASSPFDPEIRVALGQTHEALGQAGAAREHYEEALRLGLAPRMETDVRRLLEGLR